MTIQPMNTGPKPQVTAGRSQGLQESASARPEERSDLKSQQPATDRVQISDDARRLQEAARNPRQEIAQLPPGRLKELLERIYGGFYSQPTVIDKVVERLTQELTSARPED